MLLGNLPEERYTQDNAKCKYIVTYIDRQFLINFFFIYFRYW